LRIIPTPGTSVEPDSTHLLEELPNESITWASFDLKHESYDTGPSSKITLRSHFELTAAGGSIETEEGRSL
jgi:hypothetical protein